ncbi:MAG: trypsin-like peptidase domain-containing protein [Candidatus Aureabacteria bacterium]|nr:trypsin-like peptidase domain-containing protein [Candidatus Auribacterota bacterium]
MVKVKDTKAQWHNGPNREDFLSLLFIFCCVFFLGQAPADTFTIPNAVIQIFSHEQVFNPALPWLSSPLNASSGSGFVLEGNLLLTNAHVVSQAKYIEVKKQNEAKRYLAVIKWISHVSDLAILEVSSSTFYDNLTPLSLGPIPKLNSIVKAAGFPLGGEKLSITNGIVSRIDRIIYSHSGVDEHLVIQTDAALNLGNSGGPVIQNDLVVGMAFQGLGTGDNIGYLIPSTLIKHFLQDIQDGHVDGVPELGINFLPLPPVMRQFLRLPQEKSGILINDVHPLGPCHQILIKNDILTSINGYPILDDGSITLEGLQVAFYEIIERSQMNESISLEWYRNGEKNNQTVRLTKIPFVLDVGMTYETHRGYVICAGLVFVKLNGEYMHFFGKDWWTQMPHPFRLLYYYQTRFNQDPERKYYVVLSAVLKDFFNAHAAPFQNEILQTINDVPIHCLDDVKTAFSKSKGSFHVLRFFENSTPLILNAEKSSARQSHLLKKYAVPMAMDQEKSQ